MMKLLILIAASAGLALGADDGDRVWEYRDVPGWEQPSRSGRMFDEATVETVSGEIQAVHRIASMKGMSRGVHMTLKTEKGPVEVHLGPAWYIDQQEEGLSKGDKVEVEGSRVKIDGGDAIIAVEVRKGDALLKLRDEDGFPLWSGWRRRER